MNVLVFLHYIIDDLKNYSDIINYDGFYKLKMLSIATIATNKRIILFSDIQNEIGCNENEAESLLIDAIGDGYVGGSINSKEKTLVVEDFIARDVDLDNIDDVINKVEKWSGKIEKTMDEFKKVIH